MIRMVRIKDGVWVNVDKISRVERLPGERGMTVSVILEPGQRILLTDTATERGAHELTRELLGKIQGTDLWSGITEQLERIEETIQKMGRA